MVLLFNEMEKKVTTALARIQNKGNIVVSAGQPSPTKVN